MQLNKLFQGNSLELIKKVKDGSIDLLILDPNYQDWDDFIKQGFIEQAKRVIKPSGNIICFTKDRRDFELRVAVNEIHRQTIIWTFSSGNRINGNWAIQHHQQIFWLTKKTGNGFYFNPRTGESYGENTKNQKRKIQNFGHKRVEGREFEKHDDGTWLKDVYHIEKPKCKGHPTKPEKLIRILINCLCPEDGVVLDAFFGSGVTGKVCKKIKRNFIGFELDKDKVKSFNKLVI